MQIYLQTQVSGPLFLCYAVQISIATVTPLGGMISPDYTTYLEIGKQVKSAKESSRI